MINLFLRWICSRWGHKQGWYPCPPWYCERCGMRFKKEWDLHLKQAHYEYEGHLFGWDKKHK